MFDSEDAERGRKEHRAKARGESIRAELVAKLRASGPQSAADLHAQVAAHVSLSEVAFQLDRLAGEDRAAGEVGGVYSLT
jgi:hypothetical protein